MKSWMWGVGGAVAASIVMLVLTQFLESNKAGSDALSDAQITAIIERELEAALSVDINGQTFTYGQALSKIDHNLTVVQEALTSLSEE